MPTDEDVIQLQDLSNGIKPDLESARWYMCHYKETAGNDRDEEYYFPCSNDRECCGRECCVVTAVTGGFPMWAIIVLSAIGFLLLLLLILCIIYCCWKYCCQKKKAPSPPPQKPQPMQVQVQRAQVQQPLPPPPKVEMYKRTPLISGGTLRRTRDDNLIEINAVGGTSTNAVATPASHNSSSPTYSYNYGPSTATRPKYFHSAGPPVPQSVSPKHRARRGNAFLGQHSSPTDSSPGDEPRPGDPLLVGDRTVERYSLSLTTPTSNTASERERSFEPSPMEVTYETAPKPIRIEHHEEMEITQEKRPLLSRVDIPREQKARMEYLRSERV